NICQAVLRPIAGNFNQGSYQLTRSHEVRNRFEPPFDATGAARVLLCAEEFWKKNYSKRPFSSNRLTFPFKLFIKT
ncbi:MAG TPA: hypothetical protein VF570_02450, partial [Pyrinomonadaceae bacterium]